MTPCPSGWSRFSSTLVYRHGAAAIDWLCDAFGFEIKLKVAGEQGRIEHCELVYGDGLIMLTQENPQAEYPWKRQLRSPLGTSGINTQSVMFYVDDAEAHCAHARKRGARIVEELAVHDYGEAYWSDRSYGALDLEDHLWWITQRLRNPPAA